MINAASLFGRILGGFGVDHLGRLNVLWPITTICLESLLSYVSTDSALEFSFLSLRLLLDRSRHRKSYETLKLQKVTLPSLALQ